MAGASKRKKSLDLKTRLGREHAEGEAAHQRDATGKRALNFSWRTTIVQVGSDLEEVKIPADLICLNSRFFYDAAQNIRRELDENCAICRLDMDLGVKKLTFCTSCGNNFHEACIMEWVTSGWVQPPPQPCPLCRKVWVYPSWVSVVELPDVCPVDFETYLEWLYVGITFLLPSTNTTDNTRPPMTTWNTLIQAHQLGGKIVDKEYCTVVLNIWKKLLDNGDIMSIDYISPVYDNGSKTMKELLVERIASKCDPEWLAAQDPKELPAQFLLDLSLALMRKFSLGKL